MGFVEGVSDLAADFQDLVEREVAFLQAIVEGLAFEEFHDQVVGAVLRADVVEGADIGVVEGGDGLASRSKRASGLASEEDGREAL